MTWVPGVLIVVICCVSLAGADVTITTVGDIETDGSLKCGSTVTLMCKIDLYNGTMAWKVDDSTIMSCTSGSCKTVPPYHPNYHFSFERVNGIFNISIDPFTFKENGRLFECSDGSLGELLTISVKVLPDKNTTTLTVSNTTNATENVEVKVTTGCVYPVENVHFEWFYYKEGEDPVPVPYRMAEQIDGVSNQTTTDCTSGDCGGGEVKQMESKLTFAQDEEGEEYFLQAVVTSLNNNDTIVLSSTTSYKIKRNIISLLSGEAIKYGLFIMLALIGVFCVILVVVIYCALKSKKKADPEKKRIVGK